MAAATPEQGSKSERRGPAGSRNSSPESLAGAEKAHAACNALFPPLEMSRQFRGPGNFSKHLSGGLPGFP